MRPSTGRISLWPVGVVAFLLVLAVWSITATLNLKTAPPSDFVALRVFSSAPQSALAAAYWDVAVRVIQWKYNRGNALPEQVPDDFRLTHDPSQMAIGQERAVRVAYWAKLREEWLRPENWQTTYNLDWNWPVRTGRSLSLEVWRFFDQT